MRPNESFKYLRAESRSHRTGDAEVNLHRKPGSAIPAGNILREMLQWIPETLKEPFRSVLGKAHPYGLSASSRKRLKEMPRYQETSVTLFEHELVLVDAASFLASHEEIFEHQIYNFFSATAAPVIIDAGANIGLASIYFHRAYPTSRITAIESDPAIQIVLCKNLKSFGATNVEVIHGAAWDRHGDLRFSQDHADAGRLSDHGETIVPGIRLRDLIEGQHIDLLKMDIEGAETRVLADCEGAIGGVQRMFVEYHSIAGQPQNLSRLLSVLERSGFHYYIQHTGVHSSHPLVKLKQEAGFDLQLNIFATRRELL
jgi:FkbM family methyltransferase